MAFQEMEHPSPLHQENDTEANGKECDLYCGRHRVIPLGDDLHRELQLKQQETVTQR